LEKKKTKARRYKNTSQAKPINERMAEKKKKKEREREKGCA
jgi:hypothetical protein